MIEIEVFSPRTPSEIPPPQVGGRSKAGRARHRMIASVFGALISVSLHALLIASFIVGAGHPSRRPDSRGVGQRDEARSDEEALQWVDTEDDFSPADASRHQDAELQAATSPNLVAIQISDQLLPPESQALSNMEGKASEATTTASDDPGHSRLYGLYVGQINARVERAWLRPRTAIGASSFVCRVRIDQQPDGSLVSVTLEQCNGDPRWQVSLVHAIESASPLPAPPDGSVFARVLHLTFQSAPYSDTTPVEQYEPASRLADVQEDPSTLPQHGRDAVRDGSSAVMDLRIVGSAARSLAQAPQFSSVSNELPAPDRGAEPPAPANQ